MLVGVQVGVVDPRDDAAAVEVDGAGGPRRVAFDVADKAYRTQSLPTVFFQGWAPPATVTVSVGAKF